ncbi:PKD domain-containing protein [Candidatus Bathyarchaeota archaeon]|nr:MAG: PKD domain-containing protein [Candidatus Bathyarchaeota archaeon]
MTGVKQTFWRGYHRDIFGIIWQAKTELFKRAQVKILRRLGHTAQKAPVLTSFLVITLLTSLPYLSGLVPPAQASPTPTFTFAASGDFGSLTSTTGANNLARLSSSGIGFFLGLGSLSYNSSLTGDVWCSQFKAKYSNIEIIPGDHDTGGHNSTTFGETHSYERYVSNCPLTLGVPITCGPVAGACYGKEYYLDYPATNPLARFIFASPKIYNITGVCTQALDPYWPGCSSQTKNLPCTDQYGCWPYAKADIHYNWVSAAIDNARSLGIKWTIVATHKDCISASDATCSMGSDFFNMLLSKKVDLIIQAHDNAYERSKQLALNGGSCPNISTDTNGYVVYNSGCIVDSGLGNYTRGLGSVVVVQGAWVNDLYGVNASATSPANVAEAPFFAKLMGKNTPGNGLGFTKYTISASRIDVQTSFSGNFSDSFSISNGSGPIPLSPWPALVANPGTGEKEFKFAWERATFFAKGLYWAFWANAGTCEGQSRCLYYSNSLDGATWATPTNVGVHVNREDFSVTTDGTNVYYARYNETDYFASTCRHALLFRQGAVSSGSINWQPENIALPANATTAFISPNLKLDSSGQAWIGYQYSATNTCGGDGTEQPRAIHSKGTNYGAWSSQTVLSNALSGNWAVDLTSLGNGAMYFTYWIASSPTSATDLHGRLYNSTFSPDQAISSANDKLDNNAFVFSNGPTVYAVWLDESLQRLMFASTSFKGPSTETWNRPVKIATSQCCSSSSGYGAQPWTATFDPVSKSLYLYWYNYTNQEVDIYRGLDSNWSGPKLGWTTYRATSLSSITSFQYASSVSSNGAEAIGVMFMDGQGIGTAAGNALKYFVYTTVAAGFVTVSFTTNPTDPQVGQQVKFTASASGATPPYSYSWNFGDGSTFSTTDPVVTHAYTDQGTFLVTLNVVDAAGAAGTNSRSVSIGTVSPPLFTLAITGPSSGVTGAKINFTATASGGSSPYSFTWNFGDGTANVAGGSTNPNPQSHTYTKTGTFTVKVNATDSTGKIATATSTVNVSTTIPPLSVSLSGPGSGSLGSSLTISATATGGSTPYSFSWTAIGGSPSSGTGSSLATTYSSPGTYTVSVTVTDANAKTATASTTIIVSPPPQYTLSWQGFDWDGGGEETLTMNGVFLASLPTVDTIQNSNVYVSFSLNVTSFIVQGTNKLTFTHANWDCSVSDNVRNLQLTTGTTVVYTNSTVEPLSCTQSLAYTFTIAPPSSPQALAASFSYTPINPSTGQSVTLTATAAGGVGPYTFNWNFGDGSTGSGSAVTHTYGQGATFTVKVTAIDAAQNIATSTQQVTITSALTSTFTFSPSTITPGSPISFTATVSGGTSPYSYSWNFGDGATGTGNPTSHTYSAAGPYTVTLTVTDSKGNTATASQTLTGTLTTIFTFSPPSPVIGQTVTFNATASGGTPSYSFSWSFGDGSTGTGASVTHAYLSGGNFTVTLTVKDSGSPQQTAISQKLVKIPTSLATSFVFNPSSPEVELQITFTGSASGGTAPYGFSWAFGDGGSSGANPAAHSYSSTGSFTVTLTVRDANGATATSSQTISVASAPSVSFNYSPTTPEAGSPVSFTSTTTGGVGPFTMIWFFGDGATSNANPATHTYATSGSFTANVTATDANGVKAISAKSVTVASPLTVSFTETPSSPTTGQVVTFTATTAGGVGTVSYSWSFGDGATSTGNPATHTYTSPASFTVSVTATDSDGVAAVSSQTLTVRPPLTASFTYAPSNPVTGQTVTFTATASGGTSPYTFSWSFGDGLSATGASVTHSYTTNGTYTVTLTTNDSEGRTATTSNTVPVGQQSQGYALVTSSDGKVFRLYSNGTLTLIGQPVTTQLRQISWKPDGSYALISGDSAVLLKYDGTSLTSIPTGVSTGLNFWTVSWKPDGSYALIGGSSGLLLKYNGVSVTAISDPNTQTLYAIGWNPTSNYALLVGKSGIMLTYDGATVRSLTSGTIYDLDAVGWNPNGQYALIGGLNGTVLRFNGTLVTRINTSGLTGTNAIKSIAFNPSGTLALLVGDNGMVLTYNGSTLTLLTQLTYSFLYSVSWSPSGTAYIVGNGGTELTYSNGTLTKMLSSGTTSSLRSIAWKPT